LVAMAGGSQEQWRENRWSTLTKTRISEVLGAELDAEALAQLETLQAACIAQGLSVSTYRDDSRALLDFLAAAMPAHAVLVLTASAVDARKRLYKRVHEIGAVVDLSASRERSGALSRDSIDEVLDGMLHEFGKRITPGARELVARRAGADMACVAAEVEK